MVTQTRTASSSPADSGDSSSERGERGATDIFMLMLLTTLLLFAGLVFDVGMLFNAHREATSIAAAAARAGADQVSTNVLYESGVAEIDEAQARQAVSSYIPAEAQEVDVSIDDKEIVVRVRMSHQPQILGAFGYGTFDIEAEATARVANGAP